MLRFFRHIRQHLLTENRFSKYLLYAIGEILLVVIGILIALQVDNWNERRIQWNRYEFGIERVHKRILSNSLFWETYKDRAEYHIVLIDSLLQTPDAIPPNRLLGNLLVLDLLVREYNIGFDLYLDYLDFFPTDSVQFQIYETLRWYFDGVYEEMEGQYLLEEEDRFRSLLKTQNIPTCDYHAGDSFRNFVSECGKEDISAEYAEHLMALIVSEEVRSKLQLQRLRCKELVVMTKPETNILEMLEESFEFLKDRFGSIEIVGSGTLSGNWDDGIKMTHVNEDYTIWHKTILLRDGEIKFRTDRNWTFNWGAGELDQNKLVFGGTNIPVRAGEYDIVIDLEKGTYELKPL